MYSSESSEKELVDLVSDPDAPDNIRWAAAAVLVAKKYKCKQDIRELAPDLILSGTFSHALAATNDDVARADRMLSGETTPSTEFARKLAKRQPGPRRYIPRKEAPRALAEYQARQMAERDREREHLRPMLEAGGGKVREREQRKTNDTVTQLQVQLATANGMMLRATPDDVVNTSPIARAQLLDTLMETRRLALDIQREIKSLPANAGIPSEEGEEKGLTNA